MSIAGVIAEKCTIRNLFGRTVNTTSTSRSELRQIIQSQDSGLENFLKVDVLGQFFSNLKILQIIEQIRLNWQSIVEVPNIESIFVINYFGIQCISIKSIKKDSQVKTKLVSSANLIRKIHLIRQMDFFHVPCHGY